MQAQQCKLHILYTMCTLYNVCVIKPDVLQLKIVFVNLNKAI